MEQNFHKQKLYALVIAAVAMISLLLPWISVNFLGMSESRNGFRNWGILSLLGVLGVAVISFMGNRAENYTSDFRKYATYCFGAIALGALLFLWRKNEVIGNAFVNVKAGFGLWLCLLAGLAGVALLFGLVKVEDKKMS